MSYKKLSNEELINAYEEIGINNKQLIEMEKELSSRTFTEKEYSWLIVLLKDRGRRIKLNKEIPESQKNTNMKDSLSYSLDFLKRKWVYFIFIFMIFAMVVGIGGFLAIVTINQFLLISKYSNATEINKEKGIFSIKGKLIQNSENINPITNENVGAYKITLEKVDTRMSNTGRSSNVTTYRKELFWESKYAESFSILKDSKVFLIKNYSASNTKELNNLKFETDKREGYRDYDSIPKYIKERLKEFPEVGETKGIINGSVLSYVNQVFKIDENKEYSVIGYFEKDKEDNNRYILKTGKDLPFVITEGSIENLANKLWEELLSYIVIMIQTIIVCFIIIGLIIFISAIKKSFSKTI